MSTLNVNTITPNSGTTVTIGGSGDTVTLGSGASASGFTSGIVGISTFTASGTWTKATREAALGVTIKRVIVEVQGAGGSGSNDTNSNYAHIGAGGGYAKKLIDVSSIASSTITVGSGGAGIASAGTPNAGGNSSWSDGTNTITGNGGVGGSANSSASVNRSTAGGTATGGDINIQGGPSSSYYSGQGGFGQSVLGFPGINRSSPEPSDALKDAVGYGAGGGGRDSSINAGNSGSGGDGIVIVTEIAG